MVNQKILAHYVEYELKKIKRGLKKFHGSNTKHLHICNLIPMPMFSAYYSDEENE